MANATATSTENTHGKAKDGLISWELFQRKYLSREDAYKYEWLNGVVEKTRRTVDYTRFYIIQNLQNFFYGLQSQSLMDGALITEGDVFFLNKHRRPDIAYFSSAQIQAAADGVRPVPQFVIEIISNHDAINRVFLKMQDYRAAGVQVVWHILPLTGEVHVFTGGDLRNMTVLTADMQCSAAPVLPDFELSVADVLNKRG
ncbi:Uma2 family endonuclease [Haliscomenobacter sp.]|uniref:Uma2 family endonuclease n=1 Tax=Haliscomenobacter sp. TaxID=2717303 RepID=UPI003364BF21